MRDSERTRHEIEAGLDEYYDYYNAKFSINQPVDEDAKAAAVRCKFMEPQKYERSLIDRAQPVIWAAGVLLIWTAASWLVWRVMA